MFKWHHEYSYEVNATLSLILNFMNDFNNWPKWTDQFESYRIEKIEGDTTALLAKVKNKKSYVSILFTEIEPQKKYQIFFKVPFFSQTSTLHYQIISPEKTKITVNTCVSSFLTPFFKSIFLKNVETQYPKMQKAIINFISNH